MERVINYGEDPNLQLLTTLLNQQIYIARKGRKAYEQQPLNGSFFMFTSE